VNWLLASKWVELDPRGPDLGDTRYLVPCFDDPAPLVQSIRSVGILQPPVLQEKPGGGLIPVLGRRRLHAAREAAVPKVEARIIAAEMPEGEGFALAFWDNVVHRIQDPASRAVVVKRLLELFPRETVAAEFLPVLGIAPLGPRLERLAAIGRLETPVLELLAANGIQEKTAAILAGMNQDDRGCTMELLDSLKVNANKNAEIASNLYDVAIMRGKSVAEMLEMPEAKEILDDRERSAQERAQLFRQLLRSWKFPELVEREAEFRSWAQGLPQNDSVRIHPEVSFESDRCVIEVESKAREDVERIVGWLAKRNER
jgi:ParB family chromosome partitioning protein